MDQPRFSCASDRGWSCRRFRAPDAYDLTKPETLLSNVRNECLIASILTGTECGRLMGCCGASPACQQLPKLMRIVGRREAGIAGADQRQRFMPRKVR